MPPEDSEQPGNTEKADFLDDLARTMVTARQALSDSGGKITMRRLNRREYRNTIEQLTGVKVDVGSLPADGGSGTFDTVGASQFISSDQFEQYLKLGRQRLLAHQEEAQCASCHRKIDPIGFGLENWGAAGKWRATDHAGGKGKNGKIWTIDASAAFHKGPAFGDYQELRDLIVGREEDFARGFTEHLIEYALGRPFGFTDEDLANEVVSSAKNKQFAISEFIHALVQSKSFRTK